MQTPTGRLGIFGLGVLAVLALAAVLLPSAEIRLRPQTRTQRATFTVQASSEVAQIGLNGTVPARVVVVEVEGRDAIPASGQMEVPGRAAEGGLRFTNLTDQSVSIPAGTSVLTLEEPVVRFVTTRVGTLPAGAGRSLTLPAEALTRGAVGNLPAGALRAVEGGLGLQVTVSNPFPTRGGADFSVPAPDARDRLALRRELLDSLELTALSEIQRGLAPGDFLIAPSLQLARVVEETYDPPAGQPGERLNLQLRAEFETQVVEGRDMENLARAILDTTLPAGFAPDTGSPQVDHLSDPEITDRGEARWRVRVHRRIVWELSRHQAVNPVLGLDPAGALGRLEDSLLLAAPPEITLTPGWWPRLPVLPFRVRLELENETMNAEERGPALESFRIQGDPRCASWV